MVIFYIGSHCKVGSIMMVVPTLQFVDGSLGSGARMDSHVMAETGAAYHFHRSQNIQCNTCNTLAATVNVVPQNLFKV